MNRQAYQQARRLIRDNGRSAMRWIEPRDAATLQAHCIVAGFKDKDCDPLRHREWVAQVWGPGSTMLRADIWWTHTRTPYTR